MRITFVVVGRGAFPEDMLRYDCAWPIEGSRLDERQLRAIRLQTASEDGTRPTDGRWSSFGWTVLRDFYGKLVEQLPKDI